MSKICKKRVHGNEKMDLPCAFLECAKSFHFTLLMQDDETFVKWVALLIIWLQAVVDVIFSNTVPALLFLSVEHHFV